MKTKINKHISFLLCEHNCVVVPGFGGFVANYESARIDSRSHFMYAPKKSIVFNKSLQNNDGLLINEIASCEGLTFKQAKKELDKYVLDLKESLKLFKKVFIEEIGTLLYNSEGNILFVQSNSRNHLLESFGLSTVQYLAIQRTSVQEQIEEKIKRIDKKHFTSNKKVWLKAAAVLLPLFMVSALGISNKEKIQTTYANLSPFSSSTTEIVDTKKSYSLDKFDIESPTNDIEQAVISFYEAKDNLVTKHIDLDKHFIIAGAFSSEKNAQKMIAKLKGADFSNSKIVNHSHSGLYRVCYDGFSNSSEALSSLRKIKKTNPSAWLLSLN
jgi:cell division protein FtsN/nucleoid DNA-binding protein